MRSIPGVSNFQSDFAAISAYRSRIGDCLALSLRADASFADSGSLANFSHDQNFSTHYAILSANCLTAPILALADLTTRPNA